jgi:glycerophosphoryl diester phosphodiesterase
VRATALLLLCLECLLAVAAAAQQVGTPVHNSKEAEVHRGPHQPIVIAHRGASGYLPEHTLPAKALAHAMGADFIEQDVVLTADGVPIVLHDIHLDATTDVASVFPQRARADGRYYAIDFKLAEIRQLRAHERRAAPGSAEAAFAQRFPLQAGLSGVPTLAEEIALIAGLDRSRGTRTGLYIELKASAFHRAAGMDLGGAVLEVLEQTGYAQASDRVFLQSFEPEALRALKARGTPLPLIQLIGDNSWAEDGEVDYDALRTDAGLAETARYAAGIGLWLMHIYLGRNASGNPMLSELVQRAHAHGLLVHPYTFRRDQLPPEVNSYSELLELFVHKAGVDGLFTDFPDLTRQFLARSYAGPGPAQEALP